MSNILTPVSLWKNFNDTLPLNTQCLSEKVEDGVKFKYVKFEGREIGSKRVQIFGVYAESSISASEECVFVLPDSRDTIDENLLKYFVSNGYSAFSIDYRGDVEGVENYTEYPEEIYYANYFKAGRFVNYVDEDAQKTSWFEWVAVARYAYKYLCEYFDENKIGVVGIRDGGEIVWKLITLVKFSCAVTVCSAGWKAYEGFNKFDSIEPDLNEERYRFIAGIDSQAYAPYIKCPVLMLCSVNDYRFDYDRAYDTFSRINEEYIKLSMIAYSLESIGCIGEEATKNTFMFLDKYVKGRHVFLPKPSDLTITVDEKDNLVADTVFDELGTVDKFGLYLAEDCKDSALREWNKATYKEQVAGNTHRFYLNVFEKTSVVYALCYATYSNGVTVWSKIAVKKISGKFRNMQSKCKVLYTANNEVDCFVIADRCSNTLGNIFLLNTDLLPKVLTKAKGILGLYSKCGLTTFRLNSPRYSADIDSILKLDICCDNDCKVNFTMRDTISGDVYNVNVFVIGNVWQSVILESKFFKTDQGVQMLNFAKNLEFSINCETGFAINNVMWL